MRTYGKDTLCPVCDTFHYGVTFPVTISEKTILVCGGCRDKIEAEKRAAKRPWKSKRKHDVSKEDQEERAMKGAFIAIQIAWSIFALSFLCGRVVFGGYSPENFADFIAIFLVVLAPGCTVIVITLFLLLVYNLMGVVLWGILFILWISDRFAGSSLADHWYDNFVKQYHFGWLRD